ncbi:MAG: MBL fold metallo-hydrolase [Bacilli bacterium]|nr:MBL fold metallo-hydrolase [Bacilli bacterium]
MASSKKTIKNVKKVAKKVKKSKHKGLILLVFIILIGIVGFLGYEFFQEKQNYQEFADKFAEFEDNLSLPMESSTDISLPSEYEGYEIKWISSDTKYLSNDGKLTRPTYLEGNASVSIKAKVKYEKKTFIYDFIKSNLEEEIEISFKITILAKDPTKEDIVKMAISSLTMPSEIDDSIGLPTIGIKDGLSIIWTSSNEAVLSSLGVYNAPIEDTIVTMSPIISFEGYSEAVVFEVLARKDERIKYYLDENFDDLNTSTRYSDIENENISYYNVLITEDPSFDPASVDYSETNTGDYMLKMRSNNENMAYFETKSFGSFTSFSFDYIYNAAKSDNTYIEIYVNDELKETISLEKSEDLKSYVYNNPSSGKIKLNFVNNIKSEKTILIDDIKVIGSLDESDLDDCLIIPSSINKSIILPKSSDFGGIITWTSLNTDVISSDGIINANLKENAKATLSASLSYRGLSKTYTFEVNVVIKNSNKTELNIYFIDIGEEDLGDCGESILITYENIDILVDAGDQKNSTYNCVRNAIMKYSLDQELDYVIATHPDSDHIGNMANVFRDFQVNNLIKFSGESFTTQKFKNLKAAYDAEPNCNVYDIYNDIINDNNKDNDYIFLNDEVYIQFIDTKHYLDSETNGRSIVFLLVAYDTKVLFTGDADNLSPHSNLESSYMNEIGDIDILKVVHHGTANGTSSEYLEVLKPEIAIICNGNFLGNKHGHPHVETIKRLYASSSIKHVYAITGGGLHCEMTSSNAYKGTCTLEESKVDRNGLITLTITDSTYHITSKLNGDNLIDLKDTHYYQSYLALGN